MKLDHIMAVCTVFFLFLSFLTVVGQADTTRLNTVDVKSNIDTDSKMYVLVNSSVYHHLEDELQTYKNDVEIMKGLDVEIYNNTYSTPNQVRKFLKNGYNNDDLVGTFFVGNLPYKEFEMDLGYGYRDVFPIDLYYTDLDNTWKNTDDDRYLEEHEGGYNELNPDIWFGRICMKTNWTDEVQLYENYFRKVHSYRTGELRLPHKALHYVDDDWVNWTDDYKRGLEDLYPDLTIINDTETTTASDYRDRIQEGYEWIQIHCHANHSAKRHAFKLNYGPKGSGGNFTSRELYEDGQKSLFSNIFTCGSANYSVENYLCGWYALTGDYGLASIGTTKPGSMQEFDDFYDPIRDGRSIGEAMKEWWMDNGESNRWWFYGMTIIGDPTLSPGFLYEGDADNEYIPHTPIFIEGDNDLKDQVESNGWNGDGTEENPYVIEGYGIDGEGAGNCIYISNTTSHFVIKDCFIHGAEGKVNKYQRSMGILLNDVKNAVLRNNKILYNEGDGVYCTKTSNTLFERNLIKSNWESAVRLNEKCFDNEFKGNNISFSDDHGLYLSKSHENKIYRNNILNNSKGISLVNSSEGNEIYHNSFIGNDHQVYESCWNNTWYNETLKEGNYWDDYMGNDTNEDGIGEDPKYIAEGSSFSDKYPLMEPYSGEINNAPDKPSDPQPEDGAVDVSLYPVLSAHISDPDSEKVNVTFYDAKDETVIYEATGVQIEKLHGRVETMSLEALNEETTYNWYVEVNDGESTVKSEVWSFTTRKKNDTEKPKADAGNNKEVKVGEEFTLDASGSSDNEGIVSYEWDMDNGDTKTGEEIKYSYDKSGTYEVKLTVTDDAGNKDSDTIKIEVEKKDENGDNSIPGFTLIVLFISISLIEVYLNKSKNDY